MADLETILSVSEPALLEQLAEECGELAQAALELAKQERGENPTPKTKQECVKALTEELADVELCIELMEAKHVIDPLIVRAFFEGKRECWAQRVREAKKEKLKEPKESEKDFNIDLWISLIFEKIINGQDFCGTCSCRENYPRCINRCLKNHREFEGKGHE